MAECVLRSLGGSKCRKQLPLLELGEQREELKAMKTDA
jgi:hypothetical protein